MSASLAALPQAPYALAAFLLIGVGLASLAAAATGRALALAWRPFWPAIPAAALAALAASFLCYALCDLPVIAASALIDAASAGDLGGVARGLEGAGLIFLPAAFCAFASWRVARARHMLRQYQGIAF